MNDGAADVGAPSSPYEFDVAVSFAAEDRAVVDEIVQRLKAADLRIFYDLDHQAAMWGEDLVEYFDQIYRLKSRYAVLFVSRHYAAKMWTRHERRSALARAFEQQSPYVLPVRLDDTELAGLRPTVGYLDARQVGVDGIVGAVVAKLNGSAAATPSAITRVPRTQFEEQQLLLQRPPGWEYLYFVGRLLQERNQIETKYLDHETGYAAPTGEHVERSELASYISRATVDVRLLMSSLMRLMEPAVQVRAFGEPGQPGDADRIRHLATRWNSAYEGFMDWAARLRGSSPPEDAQRAVFLVSELVDEAILQYRNFITELVAKADEIPNAVAHQQPLAIIMTLELTVSERTSQALEKELARLKRKR